MRPYAPTPETTSFLPRNQAALKKDLHQAILLCLHARQLARQLLKTSTPYRDSRKASLKLYIAACNRNLKTFRSFAKCNDLYKGTEKLKLHFLCCFSGSTSPLSNILDTPTSLRATIQELESTSLMLRQRALPRIKARAAREAESEWLASPIPFLIIRERIAFESVLTAHQFELENESRASEQNSSQASPELAAANRVDTTQYC
ncbi:hypothetical protein [Pelagicoccus sp. SDUM812005]|uniref:hypothetical protein n=1 Tax=Pelagicoccus sp. SDUM812005 TaxID=3041257 RepID=UPI00280F926B|nr:hypothetical protein [Pelagicoccus sp. SDUM812005]MDQ8181039.1 hypothetical protein [Pelagicoccus sp. SDUM812005]